MVQSSTVKLVTLWNIGLKNTWIHWLEINQAYHFEQNTKLKQIILNMGKLVSF